jgi:hypothetical protein
VLNILSNVHGCWEEVQFGCAGIAAADGSGQACERSTGGMDANLRGYASTCQGQVAAHTHTQQLALRIQKEPSVGRGWKEKQKAGTLTSVSHALIKLLDSKWLIASGALLCSALQCRSRLTSIAGQHNHGSSPGGLKAAHSGGLVQAVVLFGGLRRPGTEWQSTSTAVCCCTLLLRRDTQHTQQHKLRMSNNHGFL